LFRKHEARILSNLEGSYNFSARDPRLRLRGEVEGVRVWMEIFPTHPRSIKLSISIEGRITFMNILFKKM